MKQMGMNMEEITMAINTDLPESKERIKEAYAFLSENGINEQNYTALKKKTENESDLRHGSMIEFMLHVGMHAEKMREIDNARQIYYLTTLDAKTLDYQIRKNAFVKCILKLSKLEYMRGISPAETLALQREAIEMINQSNLTGEDALLFLYAGMGEHFGGELERGETLRAKGIKYLKEFNYLDLESEAVPLIVWHYYLSGDLKRTIGYYESYLIPIESRSDEKIIIMAYPSVIFSYFLIGEYSRALILCENIYKKALRLHDRVAANLMLAISGRIRTYMGDMDNAENILYEAYAEARELKYGWGLYYALFGICFFQYQKGNYEASREAMYLARRAAYEYGFFPINASPFLLDVMKVIRDHHLDPVDDFDYATQLAHYLHSNNHHLKGVAYRHIALETKEKEGLSPQIKDDLRNSIELLEQCGNNKELYKSSVALAEVFLEENNERDASTYANKAWNLLSKNERADFPNRLFRLVMDDQSTVSFSNQLETTWLELRHVINEERMLTRLLTSVCRLLKAECGVFVTIGREGFAIKLAQNVEIAQKDTVQLKRIGHIISRSAQREKLDVNYKFCRAETEANGEKARTPKYSVCISFVKEGKPFAALYVESYYVNEPLTEEEIRMIEEFGKKMSDPLFAVLNYEAVSSEAATIEDEEEKAERSVAMKNTRFCSSVDAEVGFILQQIEKVAETNIPVLIIGETGAGKEVFAREVYEKSSYKKTFIKVNCGAIPESLIESELFGYEKGSFTGAAQRKKGYFELAEGGTIFLDEIGELSLMAQVKLLRVLQEHEFMRVGGNSTVKVDFRLIAATNKDLREEVEQGTFRKDLYYRLNVVQLQVPPLRRRKEDILNFAEFFIAKFCAEQNKPMCRIDEKTKTEMLAYDWPGNVRELENVMQKAVLFSKNGWIQVDLHREREHVFFGSDSAVGEQELWSDPQRPLVLTPQSTKAQQPRSTEVKLPQSAGTQLPLRTEFRTLEEMERAYIEEVLAHCGGKISGKGGAAEILGMKRTTLISRMEKLGIRKMPAGSALE